MYNVIFEERRSFSSEGINCPLTMNGRTGFTSSSNQSSISKDKMHKIQDLITIPEYVNGNIINNIFSEIYIL